MKINNLIQGGETIQFIIGCPSGWTPEEREEYEKLLKIDDIPLLKVVAESRATFINYKEKILFSLCKARRVLYMTEKMPAAYIAFQGGGALGMAHLGAWKAVSQQFNIKGVAGTSAGSIVAAFCAAGFSPEETINIFLQLDWSKLVKRQNLMDIARKRDAFSNGENFLKWLRVTLKKRINCEEHDIRFNDLYNINNIYLAIIACDLNTRKSKVFDKDNTAKDFVSFAVRASISIPGFFTPMSIPNTGEMLVDGGLLLNYPIELLYEQAQKANCALIGVRFKEQKNFLTNPTAWQTYWASVQAMQQAGNVSPDKITKYPNYIEIAIDAQDFNILDFNLARDEKEKLVERGTQAAKFAMDQYNEAKRRQAVRLSQPINIITPRSFESHTETQTTLNSDFYVKRDPDESVWYEDISHPGALLRIKAPLQMGKTLLKSKILKYAEQHGYRTVALNLRDATKEDFSNLDKFLQWFCTSTTVMLRLDYPVNEHWRISLGNSKIKCRAYFEKYLLSSDNALVLALDEVDRLFPYPEIAGEFLGMLRTWHEDSKNGKVWTQLRQIALYTEVYTQLDINQSPFNVGMEIKLTDFSQRQVQYLVQQYGLNWNTAEIEQLMNMVGGHPYLISTALKQVAQHHMTLEQLLQSAAFSEAGIYGDHLRRHQRNLQGDSQLATEFNKIVIADTSMKFNSELNRDIVVKLNELGLVKLQNDLVIPRYELYRQYFRKNLGGNTR